MTLYKKGTESSSVIISSSVFVCPSCGHTEIEKENFGSRECPKCQTQMKFTSSQTGSIEFPETTEL